MPCRAAADSTAPQDHDSALDATTDTTCRSMTAIADQRAAKISWLTEAKACSKATANWTWPTGPCSLASNA